jgi:hypothetical protein
MIRYPKRISRKRRKKLRAKYLAKINPLIYELGKAAARCHGSQYTEEMKQYLNIMNNEEWKNLN